jgi:hypothetical protein
MVTIRNLEVRFEVDGGEDERTFARLFEKYIARWRRLEAEASERKRFLASERSIGDRPMKEGF